MAGGLRQGAEISFVDLSATPIDFCDGRPLQAYSDQTRQAVEAIDQASGVVLASPVYRGSYSGVLKNLLDVVPLTALEGKPVAMLALGASREHYLAVDQQLRQVMAWFGALVIPTSVYVTVSDFVDGELRPETRDQMQDLIRTLMVTVERTRGQSFGPPPFAAKWSS